jgi:hypothetical protein
MWIWSRALRHRTQKQVNALVRLALETAWELVVGHAHIFPFGVVLRKDGQAALFSHDYEGSPSDEQVLPVRSL